MKSTKRALAAFMIAVTVLAVQAVGSPAVGKNFWEQKKSMSAEQSQEKTLQRLRKCDNLEVVLEDSEVVQILKETMGDASKQYMDATAIMELPDVRGNDLYAIGSAGDLTPVRETFFDLNLSSKTLCVVMLNGTRISVYGSDSEANLPEPVKDYLQDIRGRVSSLKLSFERASQTPQSVANVPQI